MKRILVLLVVMLGPVIAGCGAAAEQPLNAEVTRIVTRKQTVAASGNASELNQDSEFSTFALTEPLIIRNADLELVVQDTEQAVEQINGLASELGGFVVSSQMNRFDKGVRANLTARVPVELLDTALARLCALALEVRYLSTSSHDVTEEYTDLQAQLRHLEATESQLLTFLKEAEDTEATLAVYRELQQVQSEIERTKGRMQFLGDASALSTIKIDLIPDALAQPISLAGWRPQGTLRRAVEVLIRTLQFLVDALIWVIVFILPVVFLVFGLPAIVFLWLVRRWRQRRGSSNS